jgi:predicted PurR-regulated permease PerM
MHARQVAIATLVIMGILVGAYLLWLALEVLLLLFLGILVASAIDPLVQRIRRGPFTRGMGVLAVYTVIVGCISLIAVLAAPPMLQQVTEFSADLPQLLDDLRVQADALNPRPLRDVATRGIVWMQSQVSGGGAATAAEPALVLDLGLAVAHMVVAIVSVFVIGYYWLTERPEIKRTTLVLVGPRHARRVNLIWVAIEGRLGAWVRGQLLLMAVVGGGLGVGYALLGIPGVLALALWAALAEMIPMVGPYLAVAPALLVALTISPTTALILLVYAVAIQSLEGYVLVPRVMGHAVGVSPLVVFLGILVGAALGGLVGAFLAVPIAGALQVVLQDLLSTEHELATSAEQSGVEDVPPDEYAPGLIHDHDDPAYQSRPRAVPPALRR